MQIRTIWCTIQYVVKGPELDVVIVERLKIETKFLTNKYFIINNITILQIYRAFYV